MVYLNKKYLRQHLLRIQIPKQNNSLGGNPYSLRSEKNNKLIVFFNNRDIVSFIERCCGKEYGDSKRGQNRGVEKKQQFSTN